MSDKEADNSTRKTHTGAVLSMFGCMCEDVIHPLCKKSYRKDGSAADGGEKWPQCGNKCLWDVKQELK